MTPSFINISTSKVMYVYVFRKHFKLSVPTQDRGQLTDRGFHGKSKRVALDANDSPRVDMQITRLGKASRNKSKKWWIYRDALLVLAKSCLQDDKKYIVESSCKIRTIVERGVRSGAN